MQLPQRPQGQHQPLAIRGATAPPTGLWALGTEGFSYLHQPGQGQLGPAHDPTTCPTSAS
jgi:hypothetical protein